VTVRRSLRHKTFFKYPARFEVAKEVLDATRALSRGDGRGVELRKRTGEHASGIEKMPFGFGHIDNFRAGK